MDYYVDATGGNDGNDGLTEETAWQTIAKVNAATLWPGDSVWFKRGETWTGSNYTAGWLSLTASGTPASPIIIGAYGVGADPVFDGWSGALPSDATHVWRAHPVIANAWYYGNAADNSSPVCTPVLWSSAKAINQMWMDGVHIEYGNIGVTFKDHEWQWSNSGLAYNTVIVRDDSGSPGVTGVVLQRFHLTATPFGMIKVSGNYIEVHNIKVTHGAEYGIYVYGSHCTVQDCEVTDCTGGIRINGSYNTIKSNNIHDLVMYRNWGTSSDTGARGINLFGSYNDIDSNRIVNCEVLRATVPLDGTTDGGGTEICLASGSAAVLGNRVHHNFYYYVNGIQELTGFAGADNRYDGNEFCFNLIVDSHYIFMLKASIAADGWVVENNTFIDRRDYPAEPIGAEEYAILVNGVAVSDEFTSFKNNLFWLGHVGHFFDPARPNWGTSDHKNNLYYVTEATHLNFALDASEIEADDPDFVSIINTGAPYYGDFQLADGSPCIGTGTAIVSTYSTDFFGNALTGTPCIGCHQRS